MALAMAVAVVCHLSGPLVHRQQLGQLHQADHPGWHMGTTAVGRIGLSSGPQVVNTGAGGRRNASQYPGPGRYVWVLVVTGEFLGLCTYVPMAVYGADWSSGPGTMHTGEPVPQAS